MNPRTLIGLGVAIVAALASMLLRGGDWLREGPPSLEGQDVVILGLALLSAAAAFPLMRELEKARAGEQLGGGGLLLVALTAGLAGLGIVVLLVSPELFTYLLREDHAVEILSAFCLFAGGLVLLLTAWLQPPPLRTRLAFFVAAAILILIGLEEVSWFQRLADVPTPDWLVDFNHQHELNLHNVATGESENLFYMGAFALCVLGRFSSDIIGFPSRGLRPGLAILASGALACAITYDMWRIAHIQIAFFVALSAVFAVALAGRPSDHARRALMLCVALAMLVLQLAFLIEGHRMLRLWDTTELRELLIAIALLAYALQVAMPLWRAAEVKTDR